MADLHYKAKDYKKSLESINGVISSPENALDQPMITMLILKGKILDLMGDHKQAA